MNPMPNFDELMLVDGAEFMTQWDKVGKIVFHTHGKLKFSSGRVMVTDPDHPSSNRSTLQTRAPLGEFPVFASIAETDEDDTLVSAWVRFSDQPVVSWELAEFEGEAPASTPDHEAIRMFICDAVMGESLDIPAENELDELFFEHPDVEYACHYPDADDSIFVCSTGDYDGVFTPYWGKDAAGNPVYLVIDLDYLKTPVWDTFMVDLPLNKGPITHKVLDRAGASLEYPRLPPWGPMRLKAKDGIPQIRIIRNGTAFDNIVADFKGEIGYFTIEFESGDKLEISYIESYVAVQPIVDDEGQNW